jgi:hypothetical protein
VEFKAENFFKKNGIRYDDVFLSARMVLPFYGEKTEKEIR